MNKTIKLLQPGNTPIVRLNGLFGIEKLYMKDETKNPTHTFKDRLAYEMVRPIAEAINKGQAVEKTTFGSISYGNTAYSMGYYCQMINRACKEEMTKAIVFVPKTLAEKKYGPNTEDTIIESKKVWEEIIKKCEMVEIDLEAKVYRENDLEAIAKKQGKVLDKYIDITEGLDRPAYVNIIKEAVEKQLSAVPDYVIVPFGAGILCNEIIDYINDRQLKTKVIPVSTGNPDTIATMLYGPIWVDTVSLQKYGTGWTRHEFKDKKGEDRKPYMVYHVSETELMEAMEILHKNNITAEASAASGFAILPRLKQIAPEFEPNKHSVLVINTGNGLLNFS